MKINKAGLELIKSCEGCVLHTYKDPIGVLTCCYGHTGPELKMGQTFTQAQADELLKRDLARFEEAVGRLGLTLNENQFSALVSFAYNCGEGNLKSLAKGRTLTQIANSITLYNKAGGHVLNGLVKRRQLEKNLFLLAPPKPKLVLPAPVYYKVVSGDNMTAIAKKFGTSIDAIKKLNPTIKDIDKIFVGERIRVK